MFDAVETVEASLDVTIPMVETMAFERRPSAGGLRLGFILATDVADAFGPAGMPFRQAHGVVAAAVKECLSSGRALEDLSVEEWRRHSPLFGAWVKDVAVPGSRRGRRRSREAPRPRKCGGRSPSSKKAFEFLMRSFGEWEKPLE